MGTSFVSCGCPNGNKLRRFALWKLYDCNPQRSALALRIQVVWFFFLSFFLVVPLGCFFFFNKNTLWLNETESVLLINHPILGVNNPNQLYSLCFIFSRKPNISYGEWKSQPLKLLRLHSTFGHKFKVTSSSYNLSLFLLFMHRTPPNRLLMKIFFFSFPIINCIF